MRCCVLRQMKFLGSTYDQLVCRWTIEDFRTKMETFKLGQQLESSQFVINGLKLCINLYPNGRCGCRTEYVVNFTMISKKEVLS